MGRGFGQGRRPAGARPGQMTMADVAHLYRRHGFKIAARRVRDIMVLGRRRSFDTLAAEFLRAMAAVDAYPQQLRRRPETIMATLPDGDG